MAKSRPGRTAKDKTNHKEAKQLQTTWREQGYKKVNVNKLPNDKFRVSRDTNKEQRSEKRSTYDSKKYGIQEAENPYNKYDDDQYLEDSVW